MAHIVASDGKTIYERIQMVAREGKRLMPAVDKEDHSV